jgi:hypothetical protein
MKGKLKKIIIAALTAALLISLSVPVFAKPNDIAGHWAETVVAKWYDNGIISGFPDGSFRPNEAVTRAQLAVIIDNIFKFTTKADMYFSDVNGSEWFADAVAKCSQAGIISGNPNGTFEPNKPVTREQAAKMIAEAFKLTAADADAYRTFADSSSIAAYAREYVSALYEAGYIAGFPGGNYEPKKGLTRAEALKIIDNILDGIVSAKGTYTKDASKSLLVNSKDVTLRNIEIAGDLYLAQGIGEGDVTLDGVKVDGRIVVLGGGENSIKLNNTTVGGSLLVLKEGGKVRIVASGSTEIAKVQVASGAILKEDELTGKGFGAVEVIEFKAGESLVLDGDFDEVSIEVSDVTVEVTDGKVGKMTVGSKASYSFVKVAAGASIDMLTINARTQVSGEGTVKEAVINADSVTMEKAPGKVTVSDNVVVEPIIAGQKVDRGTTKTYTPGTTTETGGGSVPAQAITLSDFALIDTNGKAHDLDLSDETDGSVRIAKFRATSNASTTEATIESITSPKTGTITVNVKRVIDSATKDIAVSDIWPPYMGDRESISIGGLREVFGTSVTVRVTLKGTGSYASYSPVTKDITIKLSNNDKSTLPYIGDWATFSYDTNTKTVTATIKSDKKNIKFSDCKDRALQMFLDMADILNKYAGTEGGVSNLSISVDGENFYNDANSQAQRTALKNDLQTYWGLNLDNGTLADLDGKTLICKYKNNPTMYSVNIIAQ